MTVEQVKMLFEAVRGDRLESLYILAVHTGLRQGELLGVKWGDVDLEALDTYSHVLPNVQESAAAAMEEVLS